MVRDGVTTSASIDRFTKMTTGSRAMQSSATAGGEAELAAATTEAATAAGATVQDSGRPVRSERTRKSIPSKNLFGIIVRKTACSAVFIGVATSPQRRHMSPRSVYRSPLLTSIGEQFRKSERVPVSCDGSKITHSCTGDQSRSELTSREKTAHLRREMRQRQRHEALISEGKESGND